MAYFSSFRRRLLITCCHLLAFSLGAFQSAYSADPPDVGLSGTAVALAPDSAAESEAAFFPPTSVFFVEVDNAEAVIDLVLNHPLRKRIEALDAYSTAIASPAYQQFSLGRLMLEGQLKMSWREAVTSLSGRGFAVGFDAKTEGFAAILHGKDNESVVLIRDRMLEFVRLTGNAGQVTEGEYRGVTAFQVNAFRFAVYEDRLLITNQADTAKWVLDRMIDLSESSPADVAELQEGERPAPGESSLLDNQRFQAFRSAVGSESQVHAFVDLQTLAEAPAVSRVLQSKINNPLAELVFGGIQSALSDSAWASAQLDLDTEKLRLTLTTPFELTSVPEQRAYYFGANGGGRGLRLPQLPETLFTLSTHRDFSDVWLRAGDLFDANVNDGIAQADATLTTLFAGRDFGEDILAAFEPEVAFIAVRQEFADTKPQPTIKLPAFAAVFELKQPDSMRRELRRTFQSLVGFLNIVGAMNGQKQLELGGEPIGEAAEMVTSTYVPEEDDLQAYDAELIFNFSPSIAFRGRQFVISSSSALARQLVSEASSEESHGNKNTDATLHAAGLQKVLRDNRDQLIAQRMLEDGNSREEATALVDLILNVVGYFKETSVALQQDENELKATWEVRLKP
jgi:hypothetical protein